MKIGDVSFWYADIGLPETRRAALAGDTAVDVAIIGAGGIGQTTARLREQLVGIQTGRIADTHGWVMRV